ncbi:MAG: hypothetical protein IPH32_00900 [Bacteroidetes bacterium]|nr:hypothetical protein [Bacteroidota bacterium]
MDLLVTITNTYIEIKDLKGATEYRDKILKIEPNFIFAKVTLTEKIKKLKIIKNKIDQKNVFLGVFILKP